MSDLAACIAYDAIYWRALDARILNPPTLKRCGVLRCDRADSD